MDTPPDTSPATPAVAIAVELVVGRDTDDEPGGRHDAVIGAEHTRA